MSENKNEIFLSNLSIDIQYNSLREEILTRIKLRQQLLFFSLALASALLGFLEKLPIAAFLYPIFSTFVALSWIQNDNRIGELGSYIREYIENCKKDNKEDKIIVGLGWETHINTNRSKDSLSTWRLIPISNIGSIFVAQIVSISFTLPLLKSFFYISLFILDVLSIITVVWIFFESITRTKEEK